jgi:hypothetical protein
MIIQKREKILYKISSLNLIKKKNGPQLTISLPGDMISRLETLATEGLTLTQESLTMTQELTMDFEGSTEEVSRRKIIRWTDEEWDQLAQLVWRMRKNDPGATLVSLSQRAIEQFPRARQRDITSSQQLKPLLNRLSEIDESMSTSVRQIIPRLQEEIKDLRENRHTREELIQTMTDDEILHHFKGRVLELTPASQIIQQMDPDKILEQLSLERITKYTVKKLTEKTEEKTESYSNNSEASIEISEEKQESEQLKRIFVMGLLDEQASRIEKQFKDKLDIQCLPKKIHSIPESGDAYVLATGFISHKDQNRLKGKIHSDKIYFANGGLTSIKRILTSFVTGKQNA